MAEPSLYVSQKLERELEQKLQQEAEDRAIEEAIAENAALEAAAKAAAQQPQPTMAAASAPEISSKQAAKNLLELSGSPLQNGKSKVCAGFHVLTQQHCHHFHHKSLEYRKQIVTGLTWSSFAW